MEEKISKVLEARRVQLLREAKANIPGGFFKAVVQTPERILLLVFLGMILLGRGVLDGNMRLAATGAALLSLLTIGGLLRKLESEEQQQARKRFCLMSSKLATGTSTDAWLAEFDPPKPKSP